MAEGSSGTQPLVKRRLARINAPRQRNGKNKMRLSLSRSIRFMGIGAWVRCPREIDLHAGCRIKTLSGGSAIEVILKIHSAAKVLAARLIELSLTRYPCCQPPGGLRPPLPPPRHCIRIPGGG